MKIQLTVGTVNATLKSRKWVSPSGAWWWVFPLDASLAWRGGRVGLFVGFGSDPSFPWSVVPRAGYFAPRVWGAAWLGLGAFVSWRGTP